MDVNTKKIRDTAIPLNEQAKSVLERVIETLDQVAMDIPKDFPNTQQFKNIPKVIAQILDEIKSLNRFIDEKVRKIDAINSMSNGNSPLLNDMQIQPGSAPFNMMNNPEYQYYINTNAFMTENYRNILPDLDKEFSTEKIEASNTLRNFENDYIKPNGLSAIQGACYDEENDAIVITVNRKNGNDEDDGGNMLWIDPKSGETIHEVHLEDLDEFNKDAKGNYDGRANERLNHIEGITYNSEKGTIVMKDYLKEENSLFEVKYDGKSEEVEVTRVGNVRYYRQLAHIPGKTNEKGEREPGHLVGINQRDDEYDKVNKPPTVTYLKWDKDQKAYVEDVDYAKKVSNNPNQEDGVVILNLKKDKDKFENVQGMSFNNGQLYVSESWPNDDKNKENFKVWRYNQDGKLDKEYEMGKEGFQFRENENLVFGPNGEVWSIMPYEIVEVTYDDIKKDTPSSGSSIKKKPNK